MLCAILVFFFFVIHEKVSAIDIFVVDSGVDTDAGVLNQLSCMLSDRGATEEIFDSYGVGGESFCCPITHWDHQAIHHSI